MVWLVSGKVSFCPLLSYELKPFCRFCRTFSSWSHVPFFYGSSSADTFFSLQVSSSHMRRYPQQQADDFRQNHRVKILLYPTIITETRRPVKGVLWFFQISHKNDKSLMWKSSYLHKIRSLSQAKSAIVYPIVHSPASRLQACGFWRVKALPPSILLCKDTCPREKYTKTGLSQTVTLYKIRLDSP